MNKEESFWSPQTRDSVKELRASIICCLFEAVASLLDESIEKVLLIWSYLKDPKECFDIFKVFGVVDLEGLGLGV